MGIPYAVGYILAGAVLLPLLIFAVNKLFFEGNEAERHMYSFMHNSEEIPIHLHPDAEIEYNYEIRTAFLSKGGGKIHLESEKFYSNQYKKYFKIIKTGRSSFFDAFPIHIKMKIGFIVTVNKDDMHNPKMGTKENPIPVFKVVGDEKPIEIPTQSVDAKSTIYDNYDITQKEYENSVYVYLKYVMTKEEFKERFKKNK